jgi:protein O-mannosyl-transferase
MPENKKDFSLMNVLSSLTSIQMITIIFLIGIVVFLNGIFNKFVIDDNLQIVNNLVVHSLNNIPLFFTKSTFFNGGIQNPIGLYYRPIPSLFFSTIYTIFGPNYSAYHLFQILIYITNSCILFLFFKYFFSKPISFILALIFLIHPINSEVAFYISDTQEVLFFLFGIISLKFMTNDNIKNKNILLIILLLFMSLMSKETGMLYLIMALCYTFIFKRKKFFLVFGSLVIVSSLYFILRTNVVGILNKSSISPFSHMSFYERIINMPSVFIFYVKTFLFPLNLSSSYQWSYTTISFNHFVLPLTLVLVIFSTVIYCAWFLYKNFPKRHFNEFIFFFIWFFIGVTFHLQILPLDMTVSERWFYFPIVGILGMIGVLLNIYIPKINGSRIMSFLVIILLLLSLRTVIRSFDWRDDLTLALHDVKVSKDSYDLENRVAVGYLQKGKIEEAKIHAERSVNLYPYITNYNTLGVVYLNLGDYQKAKDAYKKALGFGDYSLVYDNLALLGLLSGDSVKDNREFIESALTKFPQDAKLWLILSLLEYETGDKFNAKVSISTAFGLRQDTQIKDAYYKIMNDLPLKLDFKINQ